MLIDLTNKKFGDLRIVHYIHSSYWMTECSCGRRKAIRSDCLRKKGYTHCGCKTAKVKIGDKFGFLTVIEQTERKYRSAKYWKCQCECGNFTEVLSNSLLSGSSKSCGCYVSKFDRKKNKKIVGKIRPYFWNNIKRGAESRNIKFNITEKQVWDLWLKQNGKCAISGLPLILPENSRQKSNANASLDRIDSKKGYIKQNIHWVHKDINKMKNSYDLQYFLDICQQITHFNTNP